MLTIRNLFKTFNPNTPLENKVLRGVNLHLEPGEFVSIIGSNGAGKSTLLGSIAGEVFADVGEIWLDGKNITQKSPSLRASDVARVFQDPLLGTCANLTIEENLSLAIKRGKRRGLSLAVKSHRTPHFKEILAKLGLGLENRLQDKMGLLSGGQRQAVSLMMAGLSSPKILLLDEHTASLDPKTAAFVLKLTQEMIEEQKLTALMVTHSMQQALDIGTRTIMLHQGQIIFDIAGEARKQLTIADLLKKFEQEQGEMLSDDSLLLG